MKKDLQTQHVPMNLVNGIHQYAISESARPFSFLNGVYGKWFKLDFELYGIHIKKQLFVMPLLMSLQNHSNSCK